jgi:hypothetical protein
MEGPSCTAEGVSAVPQKIHQNTIDLVVALDDEATFLPYSRALLLLLLPTTEKSIGRSHHNLLGDPMVGEHSGFEQFVAEFLSR